MLTTLAGSNKFNDSQISIISITITTSKFKPSALCLSRHRSALCAQHSVTHRRQRSSIASPSLWFLAVAGHDHTSVCYSTSCGGSTAPWPRPCSGFLCSQPTVTPRSATPHLAAVALLTGAVDLGVMPCFSNPEWWTQDDNAMKILGLLY